MLPLFHVLIKNSQVKHKKQTKETTHHVDDPNGKVNML